MKKIFTLLLLCVLCIGSAWGEDSYVELFTIKSSDVVTNSAYSTYNKTVDKRDWIITFGGNNKSVGTNSGNRSSCNLNNQQTDNNKYAVSPISQTDVCSVFANTTQINDVSKISYTFNGGSNQTNTNVYLIYSADGNKFSQISLTSGTQGATISSGTAFEFEECSGYFGLLFKATNSSGNWRIDDVNITFYEKEGTSPTTDPSITCAETLELPYAEENNGTFNVTWNNVADMEVNLYTDLACTNEFTDDWFIADVKTDGNIEYVLEENTSTTKSRTVYMQLYALYGDANEITKVVTVTQAAAPVTLTSIAVSGTPTKIEYTEGETFDPTGLVVTGTYDDESTSEITSGITWNYNQEPLAVGTSSIEVTAIVEDITSDAYSVAITVDEAPETTGYELVTDASDLAAGDVIVFGATKDGTTYSSDVFESKYLTAVEAPLSNNVLSTEAASITLVAVDGGWNLKQGDKFINTTAAKAISLGDEASTVWTIEIADDFATVAAGDYGRFLFNSGSPRFLNYTSATSATMLLPNIYKKVTGTPPTTDPSISANNVTLEYNATSGEIAYTITNPVEGKSLAATTEATWISNFSAANGKVTFTTEENTGAERSAVITLSYEGATPIDVTVTQSAYVAPLTTVDAIFAAATTAGKTATDVAVTFNNWVVSGVKGSNAYVTDGTKGFIVYHSEHGFKVGDILSGTVNCKVQLYNGSAELTGLTSSTDGLSVTAGGTITPAEKTIDQLSGINTGAVVTINNLTYDDGLLTIGDNSIKPYNSLYSEETPMSFTETYTYNVTGVYLQYNETKELLPRSAADIEQLQVQEYDIIIEDISNGTVTANLEKAAEGTPVTLTAIPNAGFTFTSWTVTDAMGAPVEVSNNQFTMPASAVTISATFVEKTKYTIAWSVNDEVVKSDEVYEGDAVTAPTEVSAPSYSEKEFIGWVTSETVDASEEPTLVTPTTATENTTYYAVFATAIGEGESTSLTINASTENFPTSYAAAADYSLEGISFNITQAYISGEKLQWRANGNDNGTGTMYNNESLGNIQSVTLLYNESDGKKNFTLNVGNTANPTDGTSISAVQSQEDENKYVYDCSNENANYFVLTNGTNAGYLTSITIEYGAGVTYSDYCTTVEVPQASIECESTLELTADEIEDVFAVTWTNVEDMDVNLYTDEGCSEEFTGDWFIAYVNEETLKVEYLADANPSTTESRTVYMQLYALDGEASDITKVVTVTQAAADKFNLIQTWSDGSTTKLNVTNSVTLTETNLKSIEITEDIEDVNITYTREFGNTNWQAWYVPFEIDPADLPEGFEVAYINDNHIIDGDIKIEVIALEAGQIMMANHPYVIKAPNAGTYDFETTSTLYTTKENTIDCSSTTNMFYFNGTYQLTSMDNVEGKPYGLSGGKFTSLEGYDSKPYRFYMNIVPREGSQYITLPNEIKLVNVFGEDLDDADAISEIKSESVREGAYDLMGRKATSLVKGNVYIINGKKVLFK